MDIRYRWIDGASASDDEWNRIESILATKGWASLNKKTSRLLVAENKETMAFIVFQMVPFLGPLFVPPSMRGTGIAEELADKMQEFLSESNARCYIATAESKHAEKLCESHGMKRLNTPLYAMTSPGGIAS